MSKPKSDIPGSYRGLEAEVEDSETLSTPTTSSSRQQQRQRPGSRSPLAKSTHDDWEDFDSTNTTAGDLRVAGDSESQASSSTQARVRSPMKARRTQGARTTSVAAAPRRRTPKPIPPPSPRTKSRSTVGQPAEPPGVFRQTLSLIFTTLRVGFTVFDWIISPIKPYLLLATFLFMSVYIAYCVLIYYALPRLPTFLLRSVGVLLRPFGSWSLPTSLPSWASFDFTSDMDVSRGVAALSLPISGLATSSCALLGIGCQASIFTREGHTAEPIWKSSGRGRKNKPDVDDAQLAWALTQESRSARNIFESISTLGRRADVFEHIE